MSFIINPYIFGSGGGASYIVDDYSPLIAYSIRQIDSGDSDLIRVRRSSDSAESDFNATEIGDGTLTTWTGANDGFITTLYNVGTGGATYDLVQTTAASQPQIVSSGSLVTSGGETAIDFDGTNDSLAVGASVPIDDSDIPFSFFSVCSSNVTNTFQVLFTNYAGASPSTKLEQAIDTRSSANINLLIDTGATTYTASGAIKNNTSQHLQSSVTDVGKGMTAWDDGTAGGTNTFVGTYVNTDLVVGYRGATSSYQDIKFQELFIFTTDETSNRTSIETNMNDYYSIF